MKNFFYLIAFLMFSVFSSAQNENKYKKRQPEFYIVSDAEHGFTYALPVNVHKEIVESGKYYNSSIYNATDRSFSIKIFNENTFERNEKESKLKSYYQKILSGNHNEVGNLKLLENSINLKEGSFYIRGKIKTGEFIWKTYVSEIPISGEFICNTILFFYGNADNQKLGKKIADRFGSTN